MKDTECSAKAFLNKKYGDDRRNGNGVAKVLLEYKEFLENEWVNKYDESGNPTMEYIVNKFDISTRKREFPHPDQKIYVAVYSHTVLLYPVGVISEAFCMHSSSVSTMLTNWMEKKLYSDKKFIEHVQPIVDQFGDIIPDVERSVRLIAKRLKRRKS